MALSFALESIPGAGTRGVPFPTVALVAIAPFGVQPGRSVDSRALREPIEEEHEMADGTAGRGAAGIGLGGILVIIGIIVALVWSVWLGIIIALIGLVAFGGFARGRWY
jgi:hypothetical protein